jgi:hypothetical protein
MIFEKTSVFEWEAKNISLLSCEKLSQAEFQVAELNVNYWHVIRRRRRNFSEFAQKYHEKSVEFSRKMQND